MTMAPRPAPAFPVGTRVRLLVEGTVVDDDPDLFVGFWQNRAVQLFNRNVVSADPVPAKGEPLRAVTDKWIGARCGLPDCGQPLHIVWTLGMPVSLADTVAELGDPNCAATSTWYVECEGGHTILVPPDTAEDNYEFGRCKCEPTDPPDPANCGCGDLDRLRAVLDPRATLYWNTSRDGQRVARVGDRKFVVTETTDPTGDGNPWEVADVRPDLPTQVDDFPTLTAAVAECELRAGTAGS